MIDTELGSINDSGTMDLLVALNGIINIDNELAPENIPAQNKDATTSILDLVTTT